MHRVQIFCCTSWIPSNPDRSLTLCSSVIETGHGVRSPLKPCCSSLLKRSCSQATWAASLGQPKGPIALAFCHQQWLFAAYIKMQKSEQAYWLLEHSVSAFRILTTRESVWAVIFNNHWGIHPSRLYLIFFEATYAFSCHNILWHWAWQSNYITFEALLVFVLLKPA